MRLQFKNHGARALYVIVEPAANYYEVLPNEEIMAEGELEVQSDGSIYFTIHEENGATLLSLYEAQGPEIVVTKNGRPLEPWN